ncbi:glycoside hydrolase family 2 protein [Natronoglomus mannanivorans]|uniref:Beta-galactosidase n=1 Tax=Natronoglomus mannanivorans TaxID=2979990 RepID=A0AAP2Z128_9EURY|nr:beta-galactosidase [Halobacteria archaeon AArc-xg1-1]
MNRGNPVRDSRSLDGAWTFALDPNDVGLEEGWHEGAEAWPADAKAVDVPHTWQEDEEQREYTGTAWYRRTVHLEEDEIGDRRTVVEFGAVDYETTVWVNGQTVGDNRGGYLPFELDVTDAVTAGENSIVVSVFDPDDLSEIPHGKQGDPWYTRVSGIWQSVSLRFRPTTHVTRASVTPDLETDSAFVDIEIESGADEREPGDVHVEARAVRNGEAVAIDSRTVAEETDLLLAFDDAQYWSPDSPVLYDLEVTLTAGGETIDRYEDSFGMRSIERDGDQFLLNGEPIRLRGVLEQGYYPETLYRPPDPEQFDREIAVAKELGFNLVRKHVKPAHPEFLRSADRNGILVWEEPANPLRDTDRSRDEVKTQLRDLVERDYNRPSVVVWSLYNEEWGIGHYDTEETLWTDETKQTYLASLVQSVREWDATRLVCDNSGWAHVDTDVNDYHRYYVSPDRATEWDECLTHLLHHRGDNFATRRWADPDPDPDPNPDPDSDSESDPPVMISEFGTWAMSDPTANVGRDGGDPHWYSHDFLVDRMKRPSGVEERFTDTDLEDVFGSLDALSECWCDRAMTSIEHVLGEIRKRDEIAGFVMTQLSDVEWEFNGLLDYARNEKSFHDDFAAINDDVVVVTALDSHVSWGGENRHLEVSIVNDTGDPIDGDVEWRFGDAGGRRSVTIPPHSVETLEPVEIAIPSVETARTESVVARLESVTSTGETLDRDRERERDHELERKATEPVTVVPQQRRATADVTIFARGVLAARLAELGFDVTHTLTDDVNLAFTANVTDRVTNFVADGGTVVQVPDRRGEMAANEFFEFRSLPPTESWTMAASLLYQNSTLLDGICSTPHLGWEFEDAYPRSVVTNVNLTTDTVHVGYVEGWLAEWSSPLLERTTENGRIVACAFPVRTAVLSHPVLTTLVIRLIGRSIDD